MAAPRDRLRMTAVDRFIVVRMNEPKALLPEGDMGEFVAKVLASFTPTHSIVCDCRGLKSLTGDTTAFLESLLSTGATILTPPRLEDVVNVETCSPEKLESLRWTKFEWQEEIDHFVGRWQRANNSKVQMLRVGGGELPIKFTDLDLAPFKNQEYLTVEEGKRIQKLNERFPTAEEWSLIANSIMVPPEPEEEWERELLRETIWDDNAHIVAARRTVQAVIEDHGKKSLLMQFALQQQGENFVVIPYHAHALNNVEVRDELLLGRPAVLAQRTRSLLARSLNTFEQMLSRKSVAEHELQRFLELNPTILSALGYSDVYPHVVLEREDGNLIPDFMMEPVYDDWCDILDIKVPNKLLVTGKPDRLRFSSQVAELTAQLREYGSYFEDPKLRRRVQEKYGIKCYRPRLIGIIGRDPRQVNELELRRLMTSYSDTRVLTFDQLFRVAKTRLLI